jgi:hypothetical protein
MQLMGFHPENEKRILSKQRDYSVFKLFGIVIAAWFVLTTSRQIWSITTLKPYPYPEQFDGKGPRSAEEGYACMGRSWIQPCTKQEAFFGKIIELPFIFVWAWTLPLVVLLFETSQLGELGSLYWSLYTTQVINPYLFTFFWTLLLFGIRTFYKMYRHRM